MENSETKSTKDKYNNSITCVSTEYGNEMILYFDNNDTLVSFDMSSEIKKYSDYSSEVLTQEDVEQIHENVCEGEGEFPKDWISECDLIKNEDGNSWTIHLYIDNNKWFEDQTSKDAISKLLTTEGFECK